MKIEDFHELFTDDLPVTVIGDFGTVRDNWYTDRILALMDRKVKSMDFDKDRGFEFWVEPEDEEQEGEKESVFQKALRQLTDDSIYKLPTNQFSYSKFMAMNTRLIGLSAPVQVKVDNYAELDMKVASYIANAKN